MNIERRVHDALHSYGDAIEPVSVQWSPPDERRSGIGRRSVTAVVAVVAVVALAAGTLFVLQRRSGGNQTTTVQAAGSATTSAGSFHVSMQSRSYDVAQPSHLIYASSSDGVVDLAHDASDVTTRSTFLGQGRDGTSSEQISIGSDEWKSAAADGRTVVPIPAINRWLHTRQSAQTPGHHGFLGVDPIGLLEQIRTKATIRLLDHEVVRGVPTDHYVVHYRAPRKNRPGFSNPTQEVWVSSDHLVRRMKSTIDFTPTPTPDSTSASASAPKERQEFTFEFYDFGTQVRIQPPPSDQVMEVPMRAEGPSCSPPCAPPPPANPSPTPAPKLPRPTVSAHSALELRPVLSVHQGNCRAITSIPPATSPATLQDSAGSCYELGPAALSIVHAQASPERTDDSQLELLLKFNAVDSVAFDRLAATYYQQRVALVIFGRVLSAPTINAQQFNGTAVIGNVDPQSAANVIAALSG